MADVTTLLNTGSSAQRVDIVFVAEGYTAAERAKFLADANNFLNAMLGSSNAHMNAPFSNYKNLFNASALFVASAQSGTDQPNQNIYVDTYFNASQHGSDGRLLYGDGAKVASFVDQALAANAHELTIVLVNTSQYGGAGGNVAWAAAGNSSASELILHEIGHSFAGLQDEYVDTAISGNYPLTDSSFLNSAHVTDSLSRIPWSAWLGFQDELGTVGTYEGGYYRASGIWRATFNSKMKQLGAPFSAPEKEAFALAYYAAIGDYLSVNGAIPGLYQATTPDRSLLSFDWKINGKSVNTSDTLYFDTVATGQYQSGASLSLTTVDNTGLIRKNLASTQQTETLAMNTAATNVGGASYDISSGSGILLGDTGDTRFTVHDPQTQRFVYVDGGAGNDTLKFDAALGKGSGYFVKQIGSGTILVGSQGTAYWAAAHIEKLEFSDFSVSTAIKADAAAIAKSTLHALEELYVAYFNRIPEADGLDYWVKQYAGGMSLQKIGDSFYSSAIAYSAQTGYSADMSNTAFINIIYKNVLGRPGGADQAGLDYWLQGLANGSQTRGSLVNTILSSAHTYKGDATWGWVADLLDNKQAVANKFAVDWGLNYNSAEASITNGMAIAAAVSATDIQAALALIGISDLQILLT